MTIESGFYSKYHFILNSFTESDIDSVMADVKRVAAGAQLLFIIDTFDILENYLPYTKGELFSKKELNYYSQKFICYDYFFGKLNNTQTILLDEYKVELLAAKNKLNKQLREAGVVLTNLEQLKQETEGFINDPDKTEAFFNEHFEVILLLLILNEKTHGILDEFFYFITKRLQLSDVPVKNQEDVAKIDHIFANCRHTAFSIEVFSEYINENKIKLLLSRDYRERHVYLENTFRDVQVIERINHINEAFEREGLPYFSIYLSSANKTPDIFRVMYKRSEIAGADMKEKHFHRNIYQYFLFDRIRCEYSKDLEGALALLHSLKTLIGKLKGDGMNIISVSQKSEDEAVLGIVKKWFDENSNLIDNHFYLGIYERYRTAFDSLYDVKKRSKLDKQEMVKILEHVEKKKDALLKSVDLKSEVSVLHQTFDIAEIVLYEDFDPDYRYGDDIIRNPYQHLPLLFLIQHPLQEGIKETLYKFLSENVEYQKSKTRLKTDLKDLVRALSSLPSGDIKAKMLRSMLIIYINLVAQSKTSESMIHYGDNLIPQSEGEMILDLQKQQHILNFQFLKIDLAQTIAGQQLAYSAENTDLIAEVKYLLVWLYRRNGLEEKGIELAIEGLEISHNDPRFYQGIALCYISRAYKLLKKDKLQNFSVIKQSLHSALEYLELAVKYYKLLLEEPFGESARTILYKSMIAILNSVADVSLRLYELKGYQGVNLLEDGRKCIMQIKKYFDALGLHYDTYPTYAATEFELEYYEARQFITDGMMSKAYYKILQAFKREELLRRIPDSAKYLDELFLNKRAEMDEILLIHF
jgi:hypothetical protein